MTTSERQTDPTVQPPLLRLHEAIRGARGMMAVAIWPYGRDFPRDAIMVVQWPRGYDVLFGLAYRDGRLQAIGGSHVDQLADVARILREHAVGMPPTSPEWGMQEWAGMAAWRPVLLEQRKQAEDLAPDLFGSTFAQERAAWDESIYVFSVAEVAAQLNLSDSRIRALAATLGVGRRLGQRALMFSRPDVDVLAGRRPGQPGRPPKKVE